MTIRLKLTIYWAAIIAAILLAAGVSTLLLFERQQWGDLDSALMEEADTAAASLIRLNPGAAVDAVVERLSEERDLGARRRVRIVSGDRVIADFGDRSSELPEIPTAEPVKEMRDGSGGNFRFAIFPFQLDGEAAILEDGVDATGIRRSIARLRTNLLILLPVILMGAVAGGYLIAGRALVPIIATADALARIGPRDLSRRLDPGHAKDEVARLTGAINALLERVERASNAERRFAADAAHELRTPLAVLRTGLEVAISRERSAGEYADALHAAFREVVGLCKMADQLLTLARIDQETAWSRERVDLGALVREVADAVEPLVQTKPLALVVRAADAVVVDGNPIYLKRLVINLIDNAIKFAPAHGQIEIGAASNGGQAIVRVADNGPGIPCGDLPFVFDRFFRGKARAETGNGLGLSLCREIVRLHRGEINVTNRAGQGCEFVITLPLAPMPHGGSGQGGWSF